jgi:outer membrane protein
MQFNTGELLFLQTFWNNQLKEMKFLLKYVLILAVTVSVSSYTSAQKFGYLNSAAILQEMPEVKQAEADLEVLQKQLQSRGETMLKEFQTKYQELERKNQQGEISPKELDEEAQVLKVEEGKLAQFEQDMQRQVLQRRDELLQPILDRVNTAIEEVAKENGYSYIFDSSPGTGILLYADESADIVAKVKAKLGI